MGGLNVRGGLKPPKFYQIVMNEEQFKHDGIKLKISENFKKQKK